MGKWSTRTVGTACLWFGLSLCPLAAFAMGSGSIFTPSVPVVPRSAETEYNKGLQHKAAKRFQEAVADFQRAVDQRGNFPEAWNELGYALRQLGRYAEAVRAYDQALRLRPNFPEALEYLGEAYVKMGRLEEAQAVLERLRSIDPEQARELQAALEAGK